MSKPRPGETIAALDTRAILACVNIPASTLNYWVGKGLCGPSLAAGTGQRAPRYWSARDLVIVKAIKALREAGCPLQRVALVKDLLENDWDTNLSEAVLLYDGNGIYLVDDVSEVVVRVEKLRGQAIFHQAMLVLTFPLRNWMEDAEDRTTEVNVVDFLAKREFVLRSRTRTPTIEIKPASA